MPDVVSPLALVPFFPLLAFVILGTALLLGRPPQETTTSRIVSLAFGASFIAALYADFLLLCAEEPVLVVEFGHWLAADDYAIDFALLLDPLSATLMTLTAALISVIARFCATYLTAEPGHTRFYLLLSLFGAGIFFLFTAGNIDLLIAGWEWVGLSSMLLIGFYHTRTSAVRASLRAFAIYRTCDLGLLFGAILMHHHAGTTAFHTAFGNAAWPAGSDLNFHGGTTAIALCMIWAALGKSALFPMGNWLPRAMEGPTPSSATFYGALSVHAGAYLLLRMSPLLDHAPLARAALVVIGVLTALKGTLTGRVQTDIKNQLAYATMTQIGLIFVEVGLDLPRLALFHLTSHALLRASQLLRAPSAIQELSALLSVVKVAPRKAQAKGSLRLYRLALERFHLDTLWENLARAVQSLSQHVAHSEERWVQLLSRSPKHVVVSSVSQDASDPRRHAP